MLGFVQNWFARPTNPIGIEWDGATLRLAQVEPAGNGFALRAAYHKRLAGQSLRAEAVREAMQAADFTGREAIFIPPASLVQLFTLDAGDDLATESADRMTRTWSTAAGKKLISSADKVAVATLLETLAAAGLAVGAVGLLPSTINDLSRRVFRRAHETRCTALHIHLGESATTCFIAQAGELQFVEQCAFSRATINRAFAAELNSTESAADDLRQRLLHAAAAVDWDADRTRIHRPAAGQVGHPLSDHGATEITTLCRDAARMQTVAGQAVRPLIQRLRRCATQIHRQSID